MLSIRSSSIVLTAMSIAVLGCQTTGSDRFDRTDSNHDGKLSRDEMNTYLVTEVFESRDANHDQRMTEAEWVVGGDAAQKKEFRQRDANRDGIVTLNEALAYGRTKGTANKLLRESDQDKDGLVSRAEMTAHYASKEGNPR
jgi:Ca2+-binding EF-hand superfamily protein